MKITLSDAPLQVVDKDGKIVLDWNPLKDKITHSKDIDNSTESVIESIMKASRYE